jgi:hypothetical protein
MTAIPAASAAGATIRARHTPIGSSARDWNISARPPPHPAGARAYPTGAFSSTSAYERNCGEARAFLLLGGCRSFSRGDRSRCGHWQRTEVDPGFVDTRTFVFKEPRPAVSRAPLLCEPSRPRA